MNFSYSQTERIFFFENSPAESKNFSTSFDLIFSLVLYFADQISLSFSLNFIFSLPSKIFLSLMNFNRNFSFPRFRWNFSNVASNFSARGKFERSARDFSPRSGNFFGEKFIFLALGRIFRSFRGRASKVKKFENFSGDRGLERKFLWIIKLDAQSAGETIIRW